MYSIEKIIGWKKTPLGKEAVTETLFDIHPESATFEFGIKPQRLVKTTIDTGFGEGWWARHQKIRMTALGEEFEHSFASIMQTQMKGGELYLAPRFKRLKDIPRGVQTGKMLSEFERLKIETGLMPFKKYRLKGIAKEEVALKHWEAYGSTFKELREFRADMTAEAISASAESILKQQRISASLFASETAMAFPKRMKFEEAYKPEIGKPRVGIGREATGDYYEAYSYPVRPSGYYGAGYYYGTPTYYGKPAYRGVAPSHKVFGFVPTSPIKHIPIPPPVRVTTPTPVITPSRHYATPPPIPPTYITTATPPPPITVTEITPPPPPVYTPMPPPPPPPPTPFITPPPPPLTLIPPFFEEDKKPRKKKKYKRKLRAWEEFHYIPTIEQLMRTPKGSRVVTPKMPELPKLRLRLPKL